MSHILTFNIDRISFRVECNRSGRLILIAKRGNTIIDIHPLGEEATIDHAYAFANFMSSRY